MRKMYGGMSTARYIIIGVSVVIIFAIIGVLVWYLIKQNKKKRKRKWKYTTILGVMSYK